MPRVLPLSFSSKRPSGLSTLEMRDSFVFTVSSALARSLAVVVYKRVASADRFRETFLWGCHSSLILRALNLFQA